eukprot:1905986-Pleurochrysis_carterae.AAC.1
MLDSLSVAHCKPKSLRALDTCVCIAGDFGTSTHGSLGTCAVGCIGTAVGGCFVTLDAVAVPDRLCICGCSPIAGHRLVCERLPLHTCSKVRVVFSLYLR